MSTRSRRAQLAALAALAVSALAACPGARFVDPHPPELVRLAREYQPTVLEEPVVYGLIFDLHIANAAECDAVKARITQRMRAAMLPSGRPGAELPAQDLAPQCVQQADRSLDVFALDVALAGQERTFGVRHVRALFLYFNNVDLPLPNTLKSNLITLRYQAGARGAPAPLLWGVGLQRMLSDTSFDSTSRWTYSSDPALLDPLLGTVREQLPLVVLGPSPAEGLPLFSAEETAWVKEFRVCGADPRLEGVNFTLGQQATRLDTAALPRFEFLLDPTAIPLLRASLKNPPLEFYVEACRANCDRFVDLPRERGLAIWNRHPTCVL